MAKSMKNDENLLSKPVVVGALSASGEGVRIVADESQLSVLANELGVESVNTARFEGKIRRYKKAGFRMNGALNADLVQACVVTMDPVQQILSLELDRKFLPQDSKTNSARYSDDGEMIIDPDADEPDDLLSGTVDLWEVLIEELNLAIDPFPRKEGAEFEEKSAGYGGDTGTKIETHNPFADLNTLINEKKSKK